MDEIVKNVEKIVERVKRESPATKLYVQSVFPVNPKFNKFSGHMNRQKNIPALNAKIKAVAARHGVTYIDVYKSLVTLYRRDEPGVHQRRTASARQGIPEMGGGAETVSEVVFVDS